MRWDVIGATGTLAALVVGAFAWLRADIADVRTDVRADLSAAVDAIRAEATADRSEAAADRRAHQATMDAFRVEMLRLAERQTTVERDIEGHSQLHLTTEPR